MTQKAVTHAGLDVSGKQMFQWVAKNLGGGGGGRWGRGVFPVDISSAVCRRAGNSAQWLERGLYPVVLSQAGALLSFCAPPVLPCWWVEFFGTARATCVRCPGLTTPAAGWLS